MTVPNISDLNERYYTPAEAAVTLSIGYYSMLRYLRTGQIKPAVRLGIARGNPYLIPESELRRFVEERTNGWMTIRDGKLVVGEGVGRNPPPLDPLPQIDQDAEG